MPSIYRLQGPFKLLSRREFVAGAAAAPLCLADPKPEAILCLVDDFRAVPQDFGGIHFTRAYAARPASPAASTALQTGRFPHAIVPGDQVPASFIRITNIEKILQDLERKTLDNSIVVLTAAHGPDSEDQFYEGSAHVPLLLRYPRAFPKVRFEDHLISHVDVLPTLSGLCGLDSVPAVQGRDLSKWLTSGEGLPPESIYAEGKLGLVDEWRMIVRGLDKIVVNRAFEVTHLFNLGQDPGEAENLVNRPALELRRNELQALLRIWIRKTEDRIDSSGLKRRP